ncbi:hypothetical protein Holit_03379 [Hollandina sp. SP2]
MDVQEHLGLIPLEGHKEALIRNFPERSEVPQPGTLLPKKDKALVMAVQAQGLGQAVLTKGPVFLGDGYCALPDPSGALITGIVVEHQGAVLPHPVGIGKDVFVYPALWSEEVVQTEIRAPGKKEPPPHQGEDLPFMPLHQEGIRLFIPVGTAVLHTVFLLKTLDLSVAEHGKPWHGY